MRKSVRIRIVDGTHYVCGVYIPPQKPCRPPRRLPRDAKRCWKRWDLRDAADAAVVATSDGALVGFFSFNVADDGLTLDTFGAWVAPRFRERGIAIKMWRRALRHFKPRKVIGTAVSKAGWTLVKRMRCEFPNVEFDFDKPYYFSIGE